MCRARRVQTYGGCSHACFVVALVYIDRLIQQSPGLFVSCYNVHRLLLTSLILAAKFFEVGARGVAANLDSAHSVCVLRRMRSTTTCTGRAWEA